MTMSRFSDFDDSVFDELDEVLGTSSEPRSFLDPDQQKAAFSPPNQPLMIVAAAGSGKTTVMTHRVRHLVEKHAVSASRILAVTFSVRAARELQKRLSKCAETRDVQVGTFHSVCLRILYAQVAMLPLRPGFTIVQKRQLVEVIGKVLVENGVKNDEGSFHREDVEHLLTWIERQKTRDRPPKAFPDGLQRRAYERYQEFLKEKNAIDFVDMVGMIVALFTHKPEIAKAYQEKYEHILVDEFQDTSMLQWQFLRFVVNRSLTVVGDDDQSIYGFRGASASRIFGELRTHFSDISVITLRTNYRSTQCIVQAASAVIVKNGFREPKSIQPRSRVVSGARISFFAAPTFDAEIDAVASYITRNHIRPGHVAILCRVRKNILPLFAKAFRRKGIPCTYSLPSALGSGTGVTGDSTILTSDLIAHLELIANTANQDAFGRALQKPKRGCGPGVLAYLSALTCSTADFFSRTQYAIQHDFPATRSSGQASSATKRPSTKQKEALAEFVAWVQSMQRRAEHCRVSELCQKIMRDTQYDADADWEREESGFPETVTLVDVLCQIESSNCDHLASMDDPFLRLRFVLDNVVLWEPEDSASLVQDATDTPVTQQKEKAEIGVVLGQEEPELPFITTDAVTLTTIHQAKGLEWPYVFVVRATEGTMPLQPDPEASSVEQAEFIEEERRIAYVGFTRAMRELHISACIQDQRSKISRFVWDIPRDMLVIRGGYDAEALRRNAHRAVHGEQPAESSVPVSKLFTSMFTPSQSRGRPNPLLAPAGLTFSTQPASIVDHLFPELLSQDLVDSPAKRVRL